MTKSPVSIQLRCTRDGWITSLVEGALVESTNEVPYTPIAEATLFGHPHKTDGTGKSALPSPDAVHVVPRVPCPRFIGQH